MNNVKDSIGNLIFLLVIRTLGVAFLWLALNKVFREFNLPEFSFWVYLGLEFGRVFALNSFNDKKER